MNINDSTVLQEILALSKESAAADAKMSAEISNMNKDISAMKSRMDKQDVLLEHLATQVNQQKRLMEEMAQLRKTIEEQGEQIRDLQNAPANDALKMQNHITGKVFDAVLTFIISAITSGSAFVFFFKFFRG